MAEVTIILKTDADGGAGIWYGDAFARTHPMLDWDWNSSDVFDFLGTDLKAVNPENVMFLRFDITGIPSGATVLFAIIEIHALAVVHEGPNGVFKVGVLLNDNKWNLNAFGFVEGIGADEYEPSTELPFPTDPGTNSLNPGVLLLERFAGSPINYNDTAEANRTWTFGDPSMSPDRPFSGDGLGFDIQLLRGTFGYTKIGIVLDPAGVPTSGPESIEIETDDAIPKGTRGPRLILTYEENPPAITSAPGPAFGSPGVLYDYGPLTANDPAPGDSATVTFALVDPEDGMTVILDGGAWRFDWTPSLTAPAVYTVKLQATDEDGFISAVQTWTVAIQPDGAPGEVCSELEITKAVAGSIEVTEGVGGSMGVNVAVSGTLDVLPTVEGTLEITPTVEGTLEVEKCR